MGRGFCRLFICAVVLGASSNSALAAPPASCAYKFVGTWVYPGGTTVVAPGGVAYPKCPMCVPTQSWTCQGNTYLFSNSGPPGQFSATLSPDGTQLIGGGTVATRVGGPAVAAKQPPKETPLQKATSTSQQAKTSPQTGANVATRKSANCSDITGTSSTAPAVTHCKDANRSLKAARVTRKEYPAYSADQYKKAAASARSAGDTSLELTILREAEAPMVADKPIDSPERSANLREAFTYIKAAEAIEQNDATCAGLSAAADNYFAAGRIFLQAIKIGTPKEEAEKSYEFAKSNEMFRKRDALNELVDTAKRENRCHAKVAAAPTPPPGDVSSGQGETTEQCDKGLNELARLKAELKKSGLKKSDNVYRGVCGPLGIFTIELAALGCVEPGENLPGKRGCGSTACKDTKAKWKTENRSASEIETGLAAAGCGEVK